MVEVISFKIIVPRYRDLGTTSASKSVPSCVDVLRQRQAVRGKMRLENQIEPVRDESIDANI